MARLRVLLVVGAVAVASLSLSACGTGGAVASARAACTYVHRAISLEREAQSPGITSARAATLHARAVATLIAGTADAAAATSADGSWNPLMTTINEAERVPFANLVPALTRLCQVADSSTPYL